MQQLWSAREACSPIPMLHVYEGAKSTGASVGKCSWYATILGEHQWVRLTGRSDVDGDVWSNIDCHHFGAGIAFVSEGELQSHE